MRKYRIIFHVRPISFLFRWDWYSFYRWKFPDESYYTNELTKIVDLGIFVIGVRIKLK